MNGDGKPWLTYQQAGELLGISAEAARQRAHRQDWPRRRDGNRPNDPMRVQVPDDELLRTDSKPAQTTVQTPEQPYVPNGLEAELRRQLEAAEARATAAEAQARDAEKRAAEAGTRAGVAEARAEERQASLERAHADLERERARADRTDKRVSEVEAARLAAELARQASEAEAVRLRDDLAAWEAGSRLAQAWRVLFMRKRG
jgi:flagellar biosynthesis/type III secretory pathway protein FliH